MNWSNQALKLTMGCGALAQTAILVDALKPIISIWGAIALFVAPIAIVAMIKIDDDLPSGLIKAAHALSVAIYSALLIATVTYMAMRGFEPTDTIMGFLLFLGVIPCVAIVRAIARGDYDRSRQE